MEWLSSVNWKVHRTTHKVPVELPVIEKLNPVDRVPEYFTRKEETRKVSKDCYVSWNGNRYSVPRIYAGREALGALRKERGEGDNTPNKCAKDGKTERQESKGISQEYRNYQLITDNIIDGILTFWGNFKGRNNTLENMRAPGFEPEARAWQARVLPGYTTPA